MLSVLDKMKTDAQEPVIITGGATFLGSATVWALNRRAHDAIYIVDDLSCAEKWRNLVNLKFTDFITTQDFLEKLELGVFDDAKGVIHFGNMFDQNTSDAATFLKHNYDYSKRIAQWAYAEKKRFVYASCASTYGKGELGFSDKDENLPKLHPQCIDGYSKHLLDLWAYKNGVLKVAAALKFFHVFGPNEYYQCARISRVKSIFDEIIATGKVCLAPNDIQPLEDFIYIKDAVDMALHIFDKKTANGVFNIGSGETTSVQNVAKCVFKALEREATFEFVEGVASIAKTQLHAMRADISHLRQSAYRKELKPLDSAIAEYILMYLTAEDAHLGNYLEK